MKVLIGVDGSSHSFAAVEFVGRLLRPESDELTLVFAGPPMAFDDDRLEPSIAERARSALSTTILNAALERLPSAWHGHIQARETSGSPSARILEIADDIEADLIAVGSRGTSGVLERFMLGSVSRAVALSAKLPVLVVKAGAALKPGADDSASMPLRALVALANPALAERSVALLNRFSWPPLSQGWAMTVVEPMFVAELPDWVKVKRNPDVEAMACAWADDHRDEMQAARGQLAKFQTGLPPCFTSERLIVEEGRPAERILSRVRELKIDLVVMGNRNSSAIMTLFLGSTTDQVLRESPSSVLVVR